MKSKDFLDICNNKAIRWNNGSIPEIGIRHIFIVNELEDKFVFTSDEIDKIVDDILEIIEDEIKFQLEKQNIKVKFYGKRH